MPRSFFGPGLPPAANFATAPRGSRLRRLSAGVGVDLGIEHQQVDVASAGEDVIEAAVADVVGPAVAADDPDTLLHQHVGEGEKLLGFGRIELAQAFFQDVDALALLVDVGFVFLFGGEQGGGEVFANIVSHSGAAVPARTRFACRWRRGSRGRIQRCLRTESWTTPGRGHRRSWPRESWAGCRHRLRSIRSRWRSTARSPKSCETSFR